MVRRNRTEIEHEGAIYHIIIKGIEGTDIFSDNVDRNKFLKLLEEMSNSFKVYIFFYILMTTHSHLLLKTDEANLSQAMQFLNSSYAHWFNYRHIRKGHLFQDRYKSYLVLNPRYLFSIASYISLNPVEAGLVNSPEEYKWGSFRYLTPTPPNNIPSWLKIEEFLKLCDTPKAKEYFVNFVKENMHKKSVEKSLNELAQVKNKFPKNIDTILEKINTHLGDIKTNRNLRNLLIYLLVKEGCGIKELSNSLHLTRQSIFRISKKIESNVTTDPNYSFWLNTIKDWILS